MKRLARVLAALALVAAGGCALAALLAGLGYRVGWWHYRAGIGALGTVFWVAVGAAVAGLLAAGLGLTRLGTRGTVAAGLAATAIAAITAWIPYDLRMTANAVPPIHDITTDLADPPAFVRVATLRKPDDHPVAWDGPKVGEQQRKAYPDLAPLVVKAPREAVFQAAKAAVAAMGLDLVEADAAQGRIEATATSLLFGFKDDLVVRIAEAGGEVRVDARSKSRVGRNDFGMNAKRIRDFQRRLRASLG